ncbi:MAG TPA: COX15/CtaA family protein [Desertimonas sp.]|nr:COX15/CtaA family protein [Desertimonas sp.]
MTEWRISAAQYRAITVAALVAICAIIVTGAAVRLTGSGLGCADWPACSSTKFIDVSSRHAAIEQVNRLFTGFVSLAVIAAVLGSLVRNPRRGDLTVLSLGLVTGVVAQILLGGVTVLVDLHPAAVQGHMLLSLVLVANAVVLVRRAFEPDDGVVVRPVSPEISRHTAGVAALTALALVTGTVVTGAGPHAGDEEARRYGVAIADAARVHGTSVVLAVVAVLVLAWRLRRRPAERTELAEWVSGWIVVALLQGAIGYIQYFNEVPALLVGIHVFGATVLWAVTVGLVMSTVPTRRIAPVPNHPRATVATVPATG